jgi:hypothetical protein
VRLEARARHRLRRHCDKGASIDTMYANHNEYPGAFTVMFKEPAGYDSENKNWFWAKYTANGEIMKNPKGTLLAGRAAKGTDAGRIACHTVMCVADLEVLLKSKARRGGYVRCRHQVAQATKRPEMIHMVMVVCSRTGVR